jgi:hypothetical protein
MRVLILPAVLVMVVACGDGGSPLGGPYGGETDPTDPNSGSNDNNNSDNGTDGGTTQQQQDSGTTQQQDSGTTTTKDSGGPPPVDSGGPPTAPTWTQVYTDYLAGGAEGRCSGCHSEGSSASNLYSWLHSKGYINGTSSKLVSTSSSCLSWYGGSMPPAGPSDAKAVSDMNAWAAAGAANN